MNEQAARALAATLGGNARSPVTGSAEWRVSVERPDGHVTVIGERSGTVFRDRPSHHAFERDGDQEGIVSVCEWGEWNDGEEWARGLSLVIGNGECCHSGGGIWLVLYRRPDGKFAVIGSESGGVYASREEFEADLYGEKAENHAFV